MAETTGISWCRSTFNRWTLLPKALAAFQLPLIADAVRLEVSQFVTRMAKCDAIRNIVGEFLVLTHRLLMVRSQITATVVAAVSTLVAIALKYSRSPFNVFRPSSKIQVALISTVAISVVISTSPRSFPRACTHIQARFHRCHRSKAIRRMLFRRSLHLQARFESHLGAFAHG